MATTTHPNNFTVTLSIGEQGATSNSVQLGGWSDAGAVITFPDIEPYANIRQGIDGDLQGTLRSGFGGDVSFEFMSDSPSVQWFQGRLAQLHNEESVTIQGVVVNSTTGETCSLVDGLLRVVRPFPNFGSDGSSAMVFTVRFQDIVPDYSGFRPTVIEFRS